MQNYSKYYSIIKNATKSLNNNILLLIKISCIKMEKKESVNEFMYYKNLKKSKNSRIIFSLRHKETYNVPE